MSTCCAAVATLRRVFSACLSCPCPILRRGWQLEPAASCIRARITGKSTETECSSINELVAPHLLPPRPPAHVALEWHYSPGGTPATLPLSRRSWRWQQHCANSTNKTWLSALLPDCEKACRSVRLGFRPANGCRLCQVGPARSPGNPLASKPARLELRSVREMRLKERLKSRRHVDSAAQQLRSH